MQTAMKGKGGEAESLFAQLDTDKSGALKKVEFGKLVASAQSTGTSRLESCSTEVFEETLGNRENP